MVIYYYCVGVESSVMRPLQCELYFSASQVCITHRLASPASTRHNFCVTVAALDTKGSRTSAHATCLLVRKRLPGGDDAKRTATTLTSLAGILSRRELYDLFTTMQWKTKKNNNLQIDSSAPLVA